jgi:phosphatidylglycerophosphatase A
VCRYACVHFNVDDPQPIVIDEFMGCIITFFGLAITVQQMFFGFLLFRFFDISKLLGIRQVEKLPGVWGVMLDDVFAGIMSNLILRFMGVFV